MDKTKKRSDQKAAKSAISAINKVKGSKFLSYTYDKGILSFIIAFAIPVILMILAFKAQDIHPFGKTTGDPPLRGTHQMLVVDLWHQYFPFFKVVREKLVGGGSFLYSWSNGLGTNFLSLISYYAASPLNVISIFFKEEYLRDALTIILIAKVGFCGAFFNCFLRYTFKRRDFSTCIFSTMFALCSYVLGYYWNVMWFDTIAMFPLVMLGVVAICREKKWLTFTVSLGLSLVFNYYIAYFTCIFTVFMFAAMILLYAKGFKDFFIKLWIMARSAVLGIALSAFMTLPAYFGLKLTYSVNNIFPKEVTWYESWTKIFGNLISYNEPTMKEGLPNFACGMLAVILLGVFIFSGNIKLREKISVVFGLALIAVSCNMNILNYIWHGFHFTNMIPYRFAFIFSFILIAAAYRAYTVILEHGLKFYQIIGMLAFTWVVFYFRYAEAAATDEGFKMTDPFKKSLIISAAFILVFIAARLFPFKYKGMRNIVLSLCIGAVTITESYSNTQIGVKTVGTSDYKTYFWKDEQIQVLLDHMREEEKEPFYRTEMTRTWTLNDSCLYGYTGLSQFSSAANVSVTRFCQRIGLYGSEAGNRYFYRISTPVVNSMLGFRYIVSKDGALKSEEMALSEFAEKDGVYMYKNNYPLSLGFMVSKDILLMTNAASSDPFIYQNKLFALGSGLNEDPFIPQPVALAQYDEGVSVTKNGFGNYTYSRDNPSGSASMYYTYDGVANSYLYGYATNGGCDKVIVTADGESVDSNVSVSDYPVVFPMGNAQEGKQTIAEVVTKSDQVSGNFQLKVYALDRDVFEREYQALADEQLEITSFSDTKIVGNVNALKDGLMFFSIPYEKGWSVYVDGEKTETCRIAHAMLGAKVSAGQHEIVLKYVPEGFPIGATATASSAVVCGVITFFDVRRRKKTPIEPDPDTDDGKESETKLGGGSKMPDAAFSDEVDESNIPVSELIKRRQEETANKKSAENKNGGDTPKKQSKKKKKK